MTFSATGMVHGETSWRLAAAMLEALCSGARAVGQRQVGPSRVDDVGRLAAMQP
jgi:hypothetical protein